MGAGAWGVAIGYGAWVARGPESGGRAAGDAVTRRDTRGAAPVERRPARSSERAPMHGRPVPVPTGVAPVKRASRRGTVRHVVAGPVTHDGPVGAVEHVTVAPVTPDGAVGPARGAWRPVDPHAPDGANPYGSGAAAAAAAAGQGRAGAAVRRAKADAADALARARRLVAQARAEHVARCQAARDAAERAERRARAADAPVAAYRAAPVPTTRLLAPARRRTRAERRREKRMI